MLSKATGSLVDLYGPTGLTTFKVNNEPYKIGMEIKTNPKTGGEYTIFQKGEDFFFADCSYVPYIGMETMIFPCDREGTVTSWIELYCDRSGMSLKDCVEEFLAE